MLKRFNPPNIAAPNSPSYHHGVEVPPNARWLSVAGQVGKGPDGKVPPSFEQQCEHVWDNILAVLAAGGMAPQDIVKVTTFLTRKEDIGASRTVRDRKLGAIAPTSTLLIVAGLAAPEFLVEIEAIAAKA